MVSKRLTGITRRPSASGSGPTAPRIWIVEVPSGAVLHEIELPTQFTDAELGDVGDEGMDMSAESLGAVVLNFSPDGAWLAVAWIVIIDILDDAAGALAFVDLARGVVTRVGAVYSSSGNDIHGAPGVGDEEATDLLIVPQPG